MKSKYVEPVEKAKGQAKARHFGYQDKGKNYLHDINGRHLKQVRPSLASPSVPDLINKGHDFKIVR
jgi:hypothetical protein